MPGAVSAWRAVSDKFGKLPFADLFEPAIRYATDGLSRLADGAAAVAVPGRNLLPEPGYREAFAPRGRAPRAGERFVCPGQAARFRRIAESEGETSITANCRREIAAHARNTGGAARGVRSGRPHGATGSSRSRWTIAT